MIITSWTPFSELFCWLSCPWDSRVLLTGCVEDLHCQQSGNSTLTLCWKTGEGRPRCRRLLWRGSCARISKGQTEWVICWWPPSFLPCDNTLIFQCALCVVVTSATTMASPHRTYSPDLNPVNIFLMLQPADSLLRVSELPPTKSLNTVQCVHKTAL